MLDTSFVQKTKEANGGKWEVTANTHKKTKTNKKQIVKNPHLTTILNHKQRNQNTKPNRKKHLEVITTIHKLLHPHTQKQNRRQTTDTN